MSLEASLLEKIKKEKINEFEALAAFYIVNNGVHDIVSISTGNKCLNKSQINDENRDLLLHDSHAEVLAKRGFI